MTWELRFLVKWANIMLGRFLGALLPGGFKGAFGSENNKKSPSVEVPFGGSKRNISSGAQKWAIQV